MYPSGGQSDQTVPARPDPIGQLPWSDDVALLEAIAKRSDEALGALYDRYGRLAFALAYRLLGERGAAEDVVQDAFLAVWRRADSYRSDRGAPRAWLMTIVHHAAIDRRRGRFKREQGEVALDDVVFAIESNDQNAFEAVIEAIEVDRVRDALAELPKEQQETLELAYFGGLTHQEIAEQTGAPLGTIKGRMRLGLTKLRGRLGEGTGSASSMGAS